MYYVELCASLQQFWSDLKLPTEQIAPFIYGFAPKVIDQQIRLDTVLPEPNRAWFIEDGINNNGDFDYLDQICDESISNWQGSIETQVGDIVVLYCLAPRSCIHSICRAVRPGGIVPFFHCYNSIWIGQPQLIKQITYSELKADPIMKELGLVKGNMQGINGRQIPKKFYDRILQLLEAKGQDISALPKITDLPQDRLKISSELDVENQVLELLLKRLGFEPGDWERQISLKVGRSERVIPDYVMLPRKDFRRKVTGGEWIWEAKYSIETNAQLQIDFGQASSYERLTDAWGVGLVSREEIWLSTRGDNFDFKKVKHFSLTQTHESDSLNEVKSIAGARALKR